ncbi:MAG: hypothetical protein R3D98_04385 [Candidatus Krumholzibacteriia bacterium]
MTRWLLPVWLLVVGLGAPAAGQDVIDLRPHATDLVVKVVQAGDDRPVTAERVMVRAQGALLVTLAEAENVHGEVTFGGVEVVLPQSYVVSAWVEGVGYHVRHTGQQFADGKAAVVHAFAQTDLTEGLRVTGMNLVVRRREGGFGFEAIVNVDNQSRPQRTVAADAMGVRLALPRGLAQITVEVDDGPEPFPATLRPAGDLTGVVAAVPPGQARITVSGYVAADAELEFTAACNLPVDAWSLMTWPADLRVDSFDMQADTEHDYAGFGRWRGRPLDPGRTVDIRVVSPRPTTAVPVFSDTPAGPGQAATPTAPGRRGVPWVTISVAAVLLAAYAVWRLRR